MANQLQIFTNSEFGEIRTVIIDGKIYFVGKDVANALGYFNTKDALARHVEPEDKKVLNAKDFQQMASGHKGRETRPLEFDSPRGLTFINENGLYSLILSSNLPEGERI